MIPLILQALITVIPPICRLIEKYVPTKFSRKRDFKFKGKMVDGLNKFHGKFSGKTVEQIAKIGQKEEL